MITAFNTIFNKNNTIRHIGCFFHYLQAIRRYLISKGYNSVEKENQYNQIMDFVSYLPFIHNIDNNIGKKLNSFFNTKKNLEFFKKYFIENWKL